MTKHRKKRQTLFEKQEILKEIDKGQNRIKLMGVAEKTDHTYMHISLFLYQLYMCVCVCVRVCLKIVIGRDNELQSGGEQKRRICMQFCLIFIGSFVRKAPELISSSQVLMDSLFGRRRNGSHSVIESRHRHKHIQPQPKTFSHVELTGIDKMKAECRFTVHIHDIYTL